MCVGAAASTSSSKCSALLLTSYKLRQLFFCGDPSIRAQMPARPPRASPALPSPSRASPAPVTLRCNCRSVRTVYMLSSSDGGGKQCGENRAVITHRRWRDACAHTTGGRAVWVWSNDLFNSSQLVRKIKGTHQGLIINQQQIHTTDNNHPENKDWWGRFSGGLVELEFSREDQTCMVTASRASVMANVTVGFHGCTWSS